MAHFDVKFYDKNSERYMLSKRIMQFCRDIQLERYITASEETGNFFHRACHYSFDE